MAIKVMLVDDEAHIRLILRRVIERNPAFCVVSECDSMTDALLAFHETQPEVVFMDIEIKGSSGIDCAKVIAQSAPDTKIIFATAYSEYMSNAFELYAFDYLVKRENCKTNQTFTSTNIMDYSVSYSDRFTNDQRSRIRHVLTYSPLIPGPKQGQTQTRSVVEGPIDLPIRTAR